MNTSSTLPNPNPLDFSVHEPTDPPQAFLNGSPFANVPDVDSSFFARLHELARYHLDSGNYTQGLANLDKCIDYLANTLEAGPKSRLLKDYVLETVKYLNEEALRLLKNDKPLEALRILEKCKELTHPDKHGIFPKQRSLTFNHIGCCYRRLGNLEKALYHLEKALQFVQGEDRIDVSGITHINLCAVLSQMQNHRKALEQAKLAVSECAYDLINANNEKEAEKLSITKKRATMLAIAYHNLGIEESYCNDDEAAMQAYFKAYKLAEEHNGIEDKLYQKFKQAHDDTVDRIIKGNRKSVPARKKKKSRLSPKNIYFKKTSLFNTNALAAKVYLQNGRVVIPNFKDYKETKEPKEKTHKSQKSVKSTRPLSGAISSGNFQKVPKALGPGEKKPRRQRPVTANARNEHSSADPKTRKYYDNDDIKNVDTSDSNSELEKFVFEDEEELEWINMKSNRLNFLSHLNQFQTHKSVVEERKSEKGINIPSKNLSARDDNPGFMNRDPERQTPKNKRMLIDTSNIYRKSSVKNEPSSTKNTAFSQISEKAEEGSSGQIKGPGRNGTPLVLKGNQKEGSQGVKNYRANQAAIILQKNWRGHRSRRLYKNKLGNVSYVTILSRNSDKPLEKKHIKIGVHAYYIVMMYNFSEEYISIQIKNLRSKKFYKTIVPHKLKEPLKNRKRAPYDLKIEAEDLLQRLSILDGCIIISQNAVKHVDSHKPLIFERTDFKKDSSQGKLGSIVNYTDTITSQFSQQESESDIVPLLTKNQLIHQSLDKKHMTKVQSNSFRESFSKKINIAESVNLPTKDSQGSPKASILKSPTQRRQVVRPFSGVQKLVSSEIEYRKPKAPSDVEDEPIEPLMKPKQKSVKIETNLSIPENKGLKKGEDKKKDQNENVVFAQSTFFKDHMLEFKLSGKFEKGAQSHNNLFLSCNDLSDARSFNDLAIPQNLLHFKEITVEDLLDILNINLKTGTMRLKKDNDDIIMEDEDELGDIKPMFPSKMKDSINDREEEKEDSESDTREEIRKLKNKMNSMPVRERKEVEKTLPDRGFTTQSDDELMIGIGPLINRGAKVSDSKSYEGLEYVVPVHFQGSDRMSCVVQHDRKKKKVVIKYPKQTIGKDGEQTKTFVVSAEALDLPNLGFSPKDFVENMSIVLVSKLTMKDGELVLKERNKMPRRLEESDTDRGDGIGEVDEDLETLRESEVRRVTSAIAASYKQLDGSYEKDYHKGSSGDVRKRKFVQSGSTPKNNMSVKSLDFEESNKLMKEAINASKAHHYGSSKGGLKNKKDDFEIEEDLPDLDDKDVQDATLKIQKAYLNKKSKANKSSPSGPAKKDSSQKKPAPKVPSIKDHKDEEIEEELPDLNDKDVQKATLAIQKAYLKKKAPKPVAAPVKVVAVKKEEKKQQKEEEEELPDLQDKDVQNATLAIQKAYLKKKQKQATGNKDQPKPLLSQEAPKNVNPPHKNILIVDNSTSKTNKKEEEEELPDINDPDVKNATLAIQKAYLKKKAKAAEPKKEATKPIIISKEDSKTLKVQGQDRLPTDPSISVISDTPSADKVFNKNSKKQDPRSNWYKKPQEPEPQKQKQEEEEELPDLQDKDVQNATLAIQKAYLKKKGRASNNTASPVVEKNIPKEVPKVNVIASQPQKEEPKKAQTKPPEKEEEEEMPDINDPEVQKASLAIQKAYLRKKAPKPTAPSVKVVEVKKEEKKEEEEMPDINDPEVQNATLAIQKAYLRKKAKPAAPAIKVVEVKKEEKKPEEEEELPDINDPEIQNATLAIQKAYLLKKNKAKQAQQVKEPVPQKVEPQKQKQEEEEELPDLQDKDVQNATLAIQKAYLKKKGRAAQNTTGPVVEKDIPKEVPKVNVIASQPQNKPAEKEEEEELPDLQDKDVQNATLAIQKAYLKKKGRTSNNTASPVVEKNIPKEVPKVNVIASQPKKEEPKKAQNKPVEKEEEEEMPDINDPEVQKASLAIQKAYLRKKAKPAAPAIKVVEVKKEEKEEEEELPDLQDKDVQNATLAIQKAYLKKKGRAAQSTTGPVVEKNISKEVPKVNVIASQPQNKPAEKEEEEELPDLKDPEVQHASLLIQNAYLKKKGRKEQPSTKPPPITIKIFEDPSGKVENNGPKLSNTPRKEKEEYDFISTKQNDKVQVSGITIKKFDKNQLGAQLPVSGDKVTTPRQPNANTQPSFQNKNQNQNQNQDGDEELPNLEDPEVQKATLAIQKAYMKKKDITIKTVREEQEKEKGAGNKQIFEQQSKPSPDRATTKHKTFPLTIPNNSSQEIIENDELPLSKNASSPHRWKTQRSYTGEIPKIVIHLDTDPPLPDPNKPGEEFNEEDLVFNRQGNRGNDVNLEGEDDDEMPDLEDPQVEKAAIAIQKAFKRSHKK